MDVIDRLLHSRTLRRWGIAARAVDAMDVGVMRRLRARARALRGQLNGFIWQADSRLRKITQTNRPIPKPEKADWVWRPPALSEPVTPRALVGLKNRSRFGDALTVFHDCAQPDLTLSQVPNTEAGAPFCLTLDTYYFDGTFLSVVLDLPSEAVAGLTRSYVVRVSAVLERERQMEVFARLNIQHGPNTEQIARELDVSKPECQVEFDLAYSELNERRVEKAWIDLIFEGAQMNEVILRDLSVGRYMRAPL